VTKWHGWRYWRIVMWWVSVNYRAQRQMELEAKRFNFGEWLRKTSPIFSEPPTIAYFSPRAYRHLQRQGKLNFKYTVRRIG